MIPKIRRGSRTYGLLAYLYGPGRRDEHVDPHLVASWDGFAPDPGRDPEATLAQLARALDLRVKQAGKRAPAQHVWHCSVRTAPDDRELSDDEWGNVARAIVHATGIAPDGDPDGCRWVAVRHADDHIHILATMVRGDLRRPRISYDFKRAQAECRRLEKELGLRRLNAGDGTAARNPTSAERFKAERTGRTETPRETLRAAVRQALAGAATETEFFDRLAAAGLRINKRYAPSGDVLGYTVALPGDRNRDGRPIWFSGSRLAPDLSLPKIRQRLTAEPAPSERLRPAPARRAAIPAVESALRTLHENPDAAAAHLVGVGELLDATAQTAPAATRSELAAAARSFERATRCHLRAEQADLRALRSAARGIAHAGNALGRGEDGGTTAMLLSTLVLAVIVAARWHAARGHAQQAAAAHQAATHLRAAYQNAARPALRAWSQQGRHLPEPARARYQAVVRDALPTRLWQQGRGDGKDALLATLHQVERAGHDPAALLKQAIDLRELDSADSINQVLVWRLRRITALPGHPDTPLTVVRSVGQRAAPAHQRTVAEGGAAADPRLSAGAPSRRPAR
ncbi:relaxase/mobilization nuclease domain-containing protein [Streptomyces aidingensis]|uniref:MobA/VirD2-like nuclease domain-containing protein n=1 Tax=Streptomyces aidingensis TaxID=910347 RepID=A0A1I1KFI8_9ACTN|nr:relaxase/mobilization nuclease domain-containing protein [Streptomyces aidingensis]SFC59295.1 hypothetical protein SAMN05421773_104205 [Streptomyces aidingensis]